MTIRFIFLLLWLLLATTLPLQAQPWQLLVLSESPQSSQQQQPLLLRRVEQTLMDQLANAGQTVYDRRLAGLPGCSGDNCFGLDDTALVSLARRSTKSIDAVLIYHIEVSELSSAAVTRWRIRIPLYLIELETGKRINSWQGFSREFDSLPQGCKDHCFTQWLAEQAALVAADAGYAITERLQSFPRTYGYTLSLRDFAIGEYQAIEQWLLEPAEFEQARLTLQQTQHNRRQWLHAVADKTYILSTQRGAGSTEALLRQVFDDNGMAVSVQLQPGTRQFYIQRQSIPYLHQYLLALAAFALLLLLASYSRFVLRHHSALAQQASRGQFSALQASVSRLQQQFWPLLPAWRRWQQQGAALQQQLDSLVLATAQAIAQQQFTEAKAPLLALSQHYSDSPQLQQLLLQLDNAETARQLCTIADSESQTAPAKAVRRYSEALQLNPALQDDINPKLLQAQQHVRTELVSGALQQGAQHLAAGNSYAALSVVDHALLQIQQLSQFMDERQQLQQLRQQALARLLPLSKLVQLSTGAQHCTLYLSDNLLIARKALPDQPSLAIGYQRLSRPGKQNIICYQQGHFWLEDQGSSNGSWLDNLELSSGKAVMLGNEATLALGGERNPAKAGICQLRLSGGQKVAGALLVQMQQSNLSLLDQSEFSQSWASLLQDKDRQACLLAQQLALGVSNDQLDIGCVQHSQPLAILSRQHDNQLYIEPVLNGQSSQLSLNGQLVYGSIPVADAAGFSLNGLSLVFNQG